MQIIEAIKERFIDLAPEMIDDENQNYLDQIQEKQVKFKTEFDQKLAKTFSYQSAGPKFDKSATQ